MFTRNALILYQHLRSFTDELLLPVQFLIYILTHYKLQLGVIFQIQFLPSKSKTGQTYHDLKFKKHSLLFCEKAILVSVWYLSYYIRKTKYENATILFAFGGKDDPRNTRVQVPVPNIACKKLKCFPLWKYLHNPFTLSIMFTDIVRFFFRDWIIPWPFSIIFLILRNSFCARNVPLNIFIVTAKITKIKLQRFLETLCKCLSHFYYLIKYRFLIGFWIWGYRRLFLQSKFSGRFYSAGKIATYIFDFSANMIFAMSTVQQKLAALSGYEWTRKRKYVEITKYFFEKWAYYQGANGHLQKLLLPPSFTSLLYLCWWSK